MSKCLGCGIELQTIDSTLPGYIPNNVLDKGYCKRCFRLIHYNDINIIDIKKTNDSIINYLNQDNKYIFYFIDILNINKYTINLYKSINNNKIFVITKIDLIDNSININNYVNNIKKIYNIKEDIILSNNNNVINYINKYNLNKVYFTGISNCGKSSLINKLLNKDILTVSNKRNTTLDYIENKINDNLIIIDTPGFLLDEYKIKSKYKNIIKPITYYMKKDEVININDFYIKFLYPTSITIYLYDKLYIKKYYKDIKYDNKYNINDNTDLCINGLGFINIKNKNNIYISGINKEIISYRKSIVGAYNE